MEAEVLLLYKNLPTIDSSGVWKPLSARVGTAFYRVFENRTFQVVHYMADSQLVEDVMKLEPPDTPESAEWRIERVHDEYYTISSGFSTTFGPFDGIDDVNAVLEPFDLFLVSKGTHLEGIAFVDELSTMQVHDAMDRLRWLETSCIAINKAVIELLSSKWREIRAICQSQIESCSDSQQALVLPPQIRLSGPKTRRPL